MDKARKEQIIRDFVILAGEAKTRHVVATQEGNTREAATALGELYAYRHAARMLRTR